MPSVDYGMYTNETSDALRTVTQDYFDDKLTPVSYTHLDVYKRQLQDTSPFVNQPEAGHLMNDWSRWFIQHLIIKLTQPVGVII